MLFSLHLQVVNCGALSQGLILVLFLQDKALEEILVRIRIK